MKFCIFIGTTNVYIPKKKSKKNMLRMQLNYAKKLSKKNHREALIEWHISKFSWECMRELRGTIVMYINK
jgi:hypothetical protein